MTNALKERLHHKLEHKTRACDFPMVQAKERFPDKVIIGQKFAYEQRKKTGGV